MNGAHDLGRALAYLEKNRARTVRELAELLRIPSVSVEPARASDVRRCAEWLAQHLRAMGFEKAAVIPTSGHPVVHASRVRSRHRPTVLIYGHYDVQPANPASAWKMPPFSPRVLGGNIWARGATDDKGQLFAHLKGVQSFLATSGELPVNVHFLFEGEEEIDSPHFATFVRRHKHILSCDVAVISDTRMLSVGRPTLTYSLRGHLRAEIELETCRDLHSGNYGGAVPSALSLLSRVVTGLHDARGKVQIPGFYDDVRSVSAAEREHMRQSGPTDDEIRKDAGVSEDWGEPGFSAYERTTIRPSLDVSGIAGGHTAQGVKAIVVGRATAKLTIRFVPDQDPRVLVELLREHVTDLVGDRAKLEVRVVGSAEPVELARTHPALEAAARAYRRGFGKRPAFVRSGGTIGVVKTFEKELGIPTVLMGFGLPTDQAHSVDERLPLDQLFRGMATSAAFLWELGRGAGDIARLSCALCARRMTATPKFQALRR